MVLCFIQLLFIAIACSPTNKSFCFLKNMYCFPSFLFKVSGGKDFYDLKMLGIDELPLNSESCCEGQTLTYFSVIICDMIFKLDT